MKQDLRLSLVPLVILFCFLLPKNVVSEQELSEHRIIITGVTN